MIIEKELNVGMSSGTCMNCGSKRELYRLSDFQYGERLLLTENGRDYVYLNCFEDTAMDEVELIMKGFMAKEKLSLKEEMDWFNKIFGVSCDYVNGVKLDAFRIRSSCLSCGSSAQSITESVPPIIVKVKFPVVTHKSWDGLNNEAKSELVLNEMLSKGYITNER